MFRKICLHEWKAQQVFHTFSRLISGVLWYTAVEVFPIFHREGGRETLSGDTRCVRLYMGGRRLSKCGDAYVEITFVASQGAPSWLATKLIFVERQEDRSLKTRELQIFDTHDMLFLFAPAGTDLDKFTQLPEQEQKRQIRSYVKM